jgi:hypothetical protein
MNDVFIPRSVERHVDQNTHSSLPHLRNVAALVVGGAVGGAMTSLGVAEAGLAVRALDPNSDSAIVMGVILSLSVFVIGLQLSGRIRPLPERKRQVPRRWIDWKRRWLTAYAYGFVLGTGALTYLRQASMYALGLMLFIAPNVTVAAYVGAIYGANRGGTILYTWALRHFGWQGTLTLGRLGSGMLGIAATVLPLWIFVQLQV